MAAVEKQILRFRNVDNKVRKHACRMSPRHVYRPLLPDAVYTGKGSPGHNDKFQPMRRIIIPLYLQKIKEDVMVRSGARETWKKVFQY